LADDEKHQEGTVGLLELVDDLIHHVNMERTWFNFLTMSTIIIVPITVFLSAFIILHPRFLRLVILRLPAVAGVLAFFIIANLVVSVIWLVFGLKEYSFISRWNTRFKKYNKLKKLLDEELKHEFNNKED